MHPTEPSARRVHTGRALVLGAAVVTADQGTKLAAEPLTDLAPTLFGAPVMNEEFTLGLVAAPYVVTLFAALVLLVWFGTHTWQAARRGRLPWWIPALLVGGGASNLVDRAFLGAVRDLVLTPWAIINLADIAVCVGVAAYVAAQVRPRNRERAPFRPRSAIT